MFKNYSFINGNNIELNTSGAPYLSSIRENFSFDGVPLRINLRKKKYPYI